MKLAFNTPTSLRWTLGGFAAGGLAGLVLFVLLFRFASSIEIIQTTRVGGVETVQSKISPQLVIDRRAAPIALIERMQTVGFARRIAERVNIDPLELAASQYGGRGRLRVRQIGDGSLIEIRAKAADAPTALKIVATAGELAVADDKALMGPFHTLIETRVAELVRERDASIAMANALSSASHQNSNSSGEYMALSSASEALAKAQLAADALWAIQSGAVGPVSQEAAVFAEATVAPPILSHWWQAVLLGAFAGATLGFAIALSLRRNHASSPFAIGATHGRESAG
jgi:hypothetical protein